MAEGQTAEGRLDLFVAMDRASPCAWAERHAQATRRMAANCLRAVIAAVPDTIHTVWTDHGTPFTALAHLRRGAAQPHDAPPPEGLSLRHACDDAWEPHGIEPRLTIPGQPWTNGPVERLNRPLNDATVTRDDDESHPYLPEPLDTFLKAYHFAKRLKTRQGLTPYESIIKCWQKAPERFHTNPCHHTVGLNS
jgi:transposase InsO family protein